MVTFNPVIGYEDATSADNVNCDQILTNSPLQQNELAHFTSYAELESKLQQLASKHDKIMKIYNNRGKSYEGRTLWIVKLSDNPSTMESDEPELLFIGAHHGNELVGNEMAIFIIETFVNNYGADPRITWLIDNHQIWVIPMPNPDGTEYTLNDESWRKNRSPNYISESTPGPFDPKIYPTSYGVDLNRNYDIEWGDPGGSSPITQRSSTYSGPEPFSEFETQTVRDLVLAHNFTFYMDYHAGIELILYPWGFTSEPTQDNTLFERLGERLSKLTGYDAVQGYDLYQTNGDSTDWIYSATRTLSFTVELSEEFRPDEDTVKEVLENNIKQPLYLTGISGDPASGSQIEILHENIGNQTDKGPYQVTATVKGVPKLSDLEVKLYYKINEEDYKIVTMYNTEENPNQYSALIPTQGPDVEVKYFITVESDILLVNTPAGEKVFEFKIFPSKESIQTSTELAAMIMMMIIIMGFFWGGFGYASFIAMRAEQRKLHEYYYGE